MIGPAPAATLVIFGATGDLTARLLAPALAHLQQAALLDPKFRILGVGREEMGADALRERLAKHLDDGAGAAWTALAERIDYIAGDFADPALFQTVKAKLSGPAAFYCATDPSFFGPLVDALGDAGLLDEADGFRRVAIEKPFGRDLASAQALNARILRRAGEAQIYRVDHFLGKETVQNILVARFANRLAEPVWCAEHVAHVQITVAETVSVGTRGKFYDSTGALRDMVPNHLFQMLALIAMESPASLDAEAIRDAKAVVLQAVKPIAPADAVRGRYTAGTAAGAPVADYLAEPNVASGSHTETFVALAARVDTPRWRDVPFYLRTGKALTARDSEIVITFRKPAGSLFSNTAGDCPPNRLILQIQPEEGATLDVVVKRPGEEVATAPASLAFRYADTLPLGAPTGYEALLYDLLIGEQALFQRADTIEAGWAAVQPLLDAWATGEPESYPAGTTGPAAADALIEREGARWHPIDATSAVGGPKGRG